MKRKQIAKLLALSMSLIVACTSIPMNTLAADISLLGTKTSDMWEEAACEETEETESADVQIITAETLKIGDSGEGTMETETETVEIQPDIYEADGYRVSFTLTDSWAGGYKANVEIENTGDFAIRNWYMGFYSENAFNDVWDAEVESYDEGLYIIKNAEWNKDIAPGQVVSFGISCDENFTGFPEAYEILGTCTQVTDTDYNVEYQLSDSWDGGFNANLLITNLSDVPVDDWSLSFYFDRSIRNVWNAKVTDSADGYYVIESEGNNGSIAPGQTVSVSFEGVGGTDADVPYNCTLSSYRLYEEETVVDEYADTDGDGVFDYIETYFGMDLNNADTDDDGLSDHLELVVLALSPVLADTDGNGVNDGEEDTDKDGMSNLQELELGMDSAKGDTDSDGLTDYEEYAVYHTDFLQYDTDEDGASDGVEMQLGTDPTVRDESFRLSMENEDEDALKVTIDTVVAGEQVESLNVRKVEDDILFSEDTPGYIGNSYALEVDGKIESGTISFEFEPEMISGTKAQPTIYGLYEDGAVTALKELDTIVRGNMAVAEMGEFSRYILLDKKAYDKGRGQESDRIVDLQKDSDGDGLTDGEEIAGADKAVLSADLDEEMILMSTNPLVADSDYDGQPDSADAAPLSNSFTGTLDTEYADSSVKFNMDYRWFFKDNTVYNADLSKTSLLLSSAVYNENSLSIKDSTGSSSTTGKTISSVLSYLGMKATKSVALKDKYSDNHVSEVGLGYTTVEYNGQKKNVVAVVVRGTNGTIEEWSSNFDIGESAKYYSTADWITKNNHAGFDIAANRIMREVDSFVNANGLKTSDTIYWITGHSRGAAIANIIGAYYESSGKKTYTYTFAAPNTTLATNTASYKSIFNIVNEDDLVPYMPMSAWGYKRYGRTTTKSLTSYEKEWENLTDIFDYNPDTFGLIDTVDELSGIASKDARVNCYKYTCSHHGDGSSNNITIRNYGMSKNSREKAIAKIPANAMPYCQITRYNGFLCAGWDFTVCQSPAYFMQILAGVMGNNISKYRFAVELNIADRYEDAKSAIVASALGGVEHPHYTESYYVIAGHVSASDF